ncbi:MAG TPA: hypothetical protein VKZ51_01730 [Cyclobacteriaceae bacterium]|nr:hypothetical protein [Cyclobacteriaceae bacterium]
MSMVLGSITIILIAVALYFLFRKIFVRKEQDTVEGRNASEEVLKKEVSHFDTKTGDEKGTGNEGVQVEKNDNNKEIR